LHQSYIYIAMKTIILLLFIYSPIFLFGQVIENTSKNSFDFQFRGGLTLAKRNVIKDHTFEFLSGAGVYKEEILKPGFEMGADMKYNIFNWLGIGMGLSFSHLKFSTNIDLTKLEGYQVSIKQSLNYVNLPLSVVFTYPTNTFSPYFKAGIMFSRLVNARIEKKYKYLDSREDRNSINDMPEYIAENHFILIGIGSKISVKKSLFSIEIGYQKGLKNTYNEEERYSHFPMPVVLVDVPDAFTVDYFQFSLGWIL